MGENEESEILFPPHTNSICIPNEFRLIRAFNAYRTSKETQRLNGENRRKLYSEVFIEDTNLGTLNDLCIRTLAKEYGPSKMPALIKCDPLKLRVHYDSLSVDLPLDESCDITDMQYWRRVVLEKSDDKSLQFKKDINWKNLGISIRFVELMEACDAEYWPEKQMEALAVKIKNYITEMHIRRLQSLKLESFETYFESSAESESETELEESYSSETASSVEVAEPRLKLAFVDDKTEEERLLEVVQLAVIAEEKTAERQARKEAKAKAKEKARAEKEARRIQHVEKKLQKQLLLQQRQEQQALKAAGKKKPVRVKNVFDIPLEEDEDDHNVLEDQEDKRNLEKYLARKKKYKYPAAHCHHIDLRVLRLFEHLTSLTMEFLGPIQGRDYHHRHFNFSYEDIQHLAFGVRHLHNLNTFRLRNSRMDAVKLDTIINALRSLYQLETVDFSNNQLHDDCATAIHKLFEYVSSMKSLELGGNSLGDNVVQQIAYGILQHDGDLEYLGVGGNPVGDIGLHALACALVQTQKVPHLSLNGIVISQHAVICCLANEILSQHNKLKQLDIVAVPIEWKAGVEFLKALGTNTTILKLDCRACDMDYELEYEVNIVLKRNQYILDNPYLGDETKTEEEINAFVRRIKNPILLHALEEVQNRSDCYQQRPTEFVRQERVDKVVDEQEVVDSYDSFTSLDRLLHPELVKKAMEEKEKREAERLLKIKQHSTKIVKPFVYDPNSFDEQEFRLHVFVPGPEEKYCYKK